MSTWAVGHYQNRQQRAQFVAANFAPCLSGRVLDVGCGDAFLSAHVECYVGVDLVGEPSVVVDLEQGTLPFADASFDTVVCTDVLEHLESLPQVLTELYRVARRYVIISLPNMYALGWRLRFLRGQVISKEYSLTPRNRHKWLPSFVEASSLVRDKLPPSWHVVWEFGYYPPAWWRAGPIYRRVARRYPNLLATAYWVLCEQRET